MKFTVTEQPDVCETLINIICRKQDERINRLVELITLEDSQIYGRLEEGGVIRLSVMDIFYAEAVDGRCYIYMGKEVYRSPHLLCDLEQMLPGRYFVRVSKSVVVNLAKLKTLEPESGRRLRIILQNGEIIIVSRQYVPALKQMLGI